MLSYILFLHQTTTGSHSSCPPFCCLISCFYIKPQLVGCEVTNSNRCLISCFYIKPQHRRPHAHPAAGCLISCFYIKPQPSVVASACGSCCLISCFYIKPQHQWRKCHQSCVVLYLVSTSNHNRSPEWCSCAWLSYILFLHQTTTGGAVKVTTDAVVLYLVSTSNHNSALATACHSAVVLYLVSTSNHNIYCLYPYTSYNYKNITLYKMVV